MKKALGVLFLALLIPTVVFASPSRVGRSDVGFDIGASMPTDDDLKASAYVNGSYSYGVNEWLGVGASLGWKNLAEDDLQSGTIELPGAEITMLPLFADFIFRASSVAENCVPYGVLGVGVIFWDEQNDILAGNGAIVKQNIDTSAAFKIGGGADYFIGDHWAVNVNANYVVTNADVNTTVTSGAVNTSVLDNLDFDYWTVGVGMKYLF